MGVILVTGVTHAGCKELQDDSRDAVSSTSVDAGRNLVGEWPGVCSADVLQSSSDR